MLRTAASKSLQPNRPYARALYTQSPAIARSKSRVHSALLASVTASAVVAALAWHVSAPVVHNDAAPASPQTAHPDAHTQSPDTHSTGADAHGPLQTLVWGSNRAHVIDPSGAAVVPRPLSAGWLQDAALRDLALHERHAACVDARGDVYQWGDAFFASASAPRAAVEARPPKITLQGKDIVKLQLTESCVYALSSRGTIYVLAANDAQQRRPASAPRAAWWGWALGWPWGDTAEVDYLQLSPREKLRWREQFTSIATGRDHLLALTSAGRVFAHPASKSANSYGQLGLYKIDLPAPSSSPEDASPARISVELIPKSVADPYAKASPYTRPSVAKNTPDNIDLVDDRHIGFSDSLFEVPALRSVKVSHISAGGRSSYVNTDTGRVLAWGANEYGQLGLGSGITLDTVVVPTEVVLSRNVSTATETKCLGISAGGDLTCFVVERTGPDGPSYVDVLTCGNGQWGGLGNNLYTTVQANPARAKNISGLLEYDEKVQGLAPVAPHAISISPTCHVLLTLDTLSRAGTGVGGRDLVVWGLNYDFQLGTGKRGSVAVPTTLEGPEGDRFLLARREAIMVRDLAGKVWRRHVKVEQCAVAGYGSSVVYWKIKS